MIIEIETFKDSNKRRLREIEKKQLALSEAGIWSTIHQDCDTRGMKNGCLGACIKAFPKLQLAFESILELRKRLWSDELGKGCGVLNARKVELLSILSNFVLLCEDGSKTLVYNINGLRVCKRFFRHATGLSYKLIRGTEDFILKQQSSYS